MAQIKTSSYEEYRYSPKNYKDSQCIIIYKTNVNYSSFEALNSFPFTLTKKKLLLIIDNQNGELNAIKKMGHLRFLE